MKNPNFRSDKEIMEARGLCGALSSRNITISTASRRVENRLLDEGNFGFDRRDMGRTLIVAAKGDHNTPVEHAEWYAEGGSEHIELRTYEGKGHFSIWDDLDILEEINQYMDTCYRDHGM